MKYTKGGGAITVRVELEAGEARFSVADNGSGIESAQLRHIFERYFRVRPGLRDGVGLGLSIAKGIVEAHRGRMWVVSKVGQGSVFYFTLPLLEERPVGGREILQTTR